MPKKLDQATMGVRTTLVLTGTRRDGSNFRPLRYHASAGEIFQKARTRPALTMPAVRYGSLRQAAALERVHQNRLIYHSDLMRESWVESQGQRMRWAGRIPPATFAV